MCKSSECNHFFAHSDKICLNRLPVNATGKMKEAQLAPRLFLLAHTLPQVLAENCYRFTGER
jgi:hypothetical protein